MVTRSPRIVIAGLKGGSGKTIASLGIVHALSRKGLRVVPFKKGPDYIDAEWLSRAAGHPCFNLDPCLMKKEAVLSSFVARSNEGDLAIIEGNRGLFDGIDEEGNTSTAELAKWLKAPVMLVVDCTKATRTIAALVLGCKVFDPDLAIGGVILNRIGTKRHEKVVRSAIEKYTDLPVAGAIRRLRKDPLPMRHLGVTPTDEHPDLSRALESLKDVIEGEIDLEFLQKVATSAPPLETVDPRDNEDNLKHGQLPGERPVIGVFRDSAFQFYYPENLEALEGHGARLVYINSLGHDRLPQIDALYIGGGFPETQADKLASNKRLLNDIKLAVEAGLPVYAECGGLMFLGKTILWNGRKYPMVGAIDWDFVVGKKPAGHGYTVLEVVEPNPYYQPGTVLRGHEFHYSRPVACVNRPRGSFACRVLRGAGFKENLEGLCYKNLFATYTHIHALASPSWAQGLVSAARSFRQQKGIISQKSGGC